MALFGGDSGLQNSVLQNNALGYYGPSDILQPQPRSVLAQATELLYRMNLDKFTDAADLTLFRDGCRYTVELRATPTTEYE